MAGPRWLREAGLVRGDDIDLAEAREIRESIRALLVANGGGPEASPADLRALRALADRARLHPVVLDGGEVDLQADEDPGPSSMAALLLIIRDAQRDDSWPRLKACRNPDCRWAYYDRSHAGRGAWCDMAVCGNRIKNRNLRSRRSTVGDDAGHGELGRWARESGPASTTRLGTLAPDNDAEGIADIGEKRPPDCA